MTTTPFAPRTPYIAVALASFRISIRSMSPGLSHDNPCAPPVTAPLIPGVLLQPGDGRFTRRDRVQRVPRREGRAHELRGPARDHAVLPDDVEPALLLHP